MRAALAGGLALLTLAIVLRVSRPPLVVAAANSTAESTIAASRGGVHYCQGGETLPAGVTAIRLGISANIGPKVTLTVLSGAQTVAEGSQIAGWTGEIVTIPIAPVPVAVSNASVCIVLGPAIEPIALTGAKAARPTPEAPGKVRIEYLHPGSRSWLSLAPGVARRLGLGRSPSGTWIALLPIALMLAAAVLASGLVSRQLRSRGEPPPRTASRPPSGLPRAALVCGVVAWLSAASWSIVMPPFQVPDEPSHFAYVQQLAQTGRLPTSSSTYYAPAEMAALSDLNHNAVRFNPLHSTISTPAQQRLLEHDLALPLPREGRGAAGVAQPQPPLYYALQTIPYRLTSSGNLLESLALMKLLSALMAGLAALFVYLFLRETLPAVPWAWTVGGLGVALFPLVGFMSGAVNPDSMLCAVSAALFFCLARAFRWGLSTRMATAIGVVTAVGFLTKLNFIGLAPGLALALAVLTRRALRAAERSSAYRSLALAAGIGASPVCLYALVNLLSHRSGLGLASTGIDLTGRHGSPLGEITYIWEFYLPRLPLMADYFPGVFTSRVWFDRSVGLYGWLDTTFPAWVYNLALIPTALIAALCARALIANRAVLRARIWELLAYAAMSVGVMVLVGADSYLEFPGRSGGYTEPRYMLPMAALFGTVFALAARGAGRRWGSAVGALIVVLILGHDIFSQLLVVARYYG